VLSRLSNQLNEQFARQTGREIELQIETLPPLSQQIARLVIQVISAMDIQETNPVYRDGLAHMLAEPEFALGEQVRQMVSTLEGPSLWK